MFSYGGYTSHDQKTLLSEFCSLFAFSLIFAILFGVYTSEPKYYGDQTCVDLLKWANETLEAYVMGAIFYGVIAPVLLLIITHSTNIRLTSVSGALIFVFRMVYGIELLGFMGVLLYEYIKNEPCGQLRSFILIYLIFWGSSLLFVILVGLCLYFGISWLKRRSEGLAESKPENNIGYNTVENQA